MVAASQAMDIKKNVNTRRTVLSIDDLHVWFELKRFGFGHAGYVKAVDGVTFDIHESETIAVVGESGCGKSSLMKTILGLYRPTKGKIVFDDKDLSELDTKGMHWYHSNVGYVQQDPYGALAPFMSVKKILEEPLIIGGIKNKQERIQRINKAMDEVKLTQRVVIARAMIMEPKFLVADEPVSMLDASVRVEILKLLSNLQKEHNLSVIYITHDLSTVSYFSERIFVMYAGNLVEKAGVRQVVDNPLHPYTMALLTGTSEPDAKNAETYKELPPGEPPSLVHPPSGCRFHPRCSRIIKGLCEVKFPPDFEPEPGHLVACWLYK
jgi:peptide/nickel transport system ATP-binding protein